MGNEQSSSTALTEEEEEHYRSQGREYILQRAEQQKRDAHEEARQQQEKADADAERERRCQEKAEEEERRRKNDKLLQMQEEALAASRKEAAKAAKLAAEQKEKEKAEKAAAAAQAKKQAAEKERQELAKREEAAKAKIAQMKANAPANGTTAKAAAQSKDKATRQAELRQKFSGPSDTQRLPARPFTKTSPPASPPSASRHVSAVSESSYDDPLASWNPRKVRQTEPQPNGANTGAHFADRATPPPAPTVTKRPAPSSGFRDNKRASIGRIPKRPRNSASTSNSPQSPVSPMEGGQRDPPEWYSKLKIEPSRGRGHDSGTDNLLGGLKDQISKAKSAAKAGSDANLQTFMSQVRDRIHKLAFLEVNEKLLRNNRMLDNQNGLPQIFDDNFRENVEWPHDIRSDAEELYNKWYHQDFDIDIMRGIECRKPNQLGGDKVKPNCQKNAKYFGNGKLTNGQWWPLLICAVRDGAHGEMVAGICGKVGVGAYSCFMSGKLSDKDKEKEYPDIDEGETVYYCGTDDTTGTGKITPGTQMLLDSMAFEEPVRFIRSWKAKRKSKYAPSRGFRYDGLYDVKDYEILDHQLQRHRFKLLRRKDQPPLRAGEGPQSRPTEDEIKAYDKDKSLRGLGHKEPR